MPKIGQNDVLPLTVGHQYMDRPVEVSFGNDKRKIWTCHFREGYEIRRQEVLGTTNRAGDLTTRSTVALEGQIRNVNTTQVNAPPPSSQS
jgi:hypothetical protein